MASARKINQNSPTKLTLKYFRKKGFPCHIVEKWVKTPAGGFRKDCFGFDILVLGGLETIGIQAGAGAAHAEKIRHAMGLEEVRQWISSPHRLFLIVTWSKRVKRNKDGSKRARTEWTPRGSQLTLVDGKIIESDFIFK